MRVVFAVLVLSLCLVCPACSEQYTVKVVDGVGDITFTFLDDQLGLNNNRLHDFDNPEYQLTYTLYCMPSIGRCYDAVTGELDAFATFVNTGAGCGYVWWDPSTPAGHEVRVQLGRLPTDPGPPEACPYSLLFETYLCSPGYTGTLSLDSLLLSFDTSHVPEPTSLVALASGILLAGCIAGRKLRCR